MPNHAWSVLCEKVIVDKETNNVSLISCREQVTSPVLPVHVANVSIATLWYKDDQSATHNEDFRLALNLIAPDDSVKELGSIKVDMKNPRQRVNFYFDVLPFQQAGTYYFTLSKSEDASGERWSEVSRLPFVVIYSPPETKIARGS